MHYTEREDEAVTSFSSLFSILLHGLLVLLFVSLGAPGRSLPTEHVFITRFTEFPPVESFSAYASDRKVFSDETTGLSTVTAGDQSVPNPAVREGEPSPTRGPQIEDLRRRVFAPLPGSRSMENTFRSSSTLEQDLPLNDAIVTTRRPEDAPSPQALPATTNRARSNTGENPVLTAAQSELPPTGRVMGEAERAAQYSGVVSDERNFFTAPASRTRGEEQGPGSGETRDGSTREISDAVVTGGSSSRSLPSTTGSVPRSAGPSASNRPIPTAVNVEPPEFQISGRAISNRRLIQMIKPTLPDWIEETGHDYSVEFRIHINERGEVTNAVVYKTSGHPELDQLAKRAVRQWLYEPRAGEEEDRLARVNFVTTSSASASNQDKN